ncbi:MAG TPA: aconitase family protein [Acidobacteriota bacterium]|jgi:3-isopropylmalate/(R)-2-methylmalate dehydratase large subunit|nr:aconitase family protein [Acidobacteriota bacterium]
MRDKKIKFTGRILYLTEDVELIKRQIAGEDLAYTPDLHLMDNISTDEITPAWVCFNYDERLGEYVYVGLRGNPIHKGDIKPGGFSVVVSGLSKGCGSSRENSPFAEYCAGIRLVIAKSIEKIYGQNCQNIGLLTSTDFSLIPRILAGEEIPIEEFTRGLDPITADVVRHGGLFQYNRARLKGEIHAPVPQTDKRPLNLLEKIIARHVIVDLAARQVGVPAVKPGDACFVDVDVRFTHDYTTAMAQSLFEQGFGKDAQITDVKSVFAFRDHLTFLGQVLTEEQKRSGMLDQANRLASAQVEFTQKHDIRLYGEVPEGGSEAICHNAVVEDIALPGRIVVGSDSHTCTAGCLGSFAFGVGSTDISNAWLTRDVRVRVPEVVKFVLHGKPQANVTAKDIILHIISTDYVRSSKAIGQVMEFAGEGLKHLNMDERSTLTNMSVEGGAFTGIIEPDEVTVDYVVGMRGINADAVRAMCVRPDPGAEYAEIFPIDLGKVEPMVATPGDPRNGIPLSQFTQQVKVDIAYAGSCTGAKIEDMDAYARVLSEAVKAGRRVPSNVQFYIQFGSQKVRRYAEKKGYIELFQKAGAKLVNPSCGACIKAGPGASVSEKQVTISAISRNFPGRSGPGKVYLGSPLTVAASALAGRIVPYRGN